MSNYFYRGKKAQKAKKAAKKKQNLQFEALENRVLLSADLGISATDLEQQDESLNTEVIESEMQLAGFDSSEFEPQTIAVDDSLTRLLPQLSEDTSVAIEAASVDASDINEADIQAAQVTEENAEEVVTEAQLQTAAEMYYFEQAMATDIIILDSSIPQLKSVINELFSSKAPDLATTFNSVRTQTAELYSAPDISAETEQLETDMAEKLVGVTLQQQLALNADREIKVFVLDSQQDGVEQISSILDYFQNVAAIHLLSHGSAGALFLGNAKLTSQQLKTNQQQLKRWGSALSEDGDLLLYGCDVADGDLGLEFIEQLAALTGADVAASDDDTGNVEGADWDLEQAVGQIEAMSYVSAAMRGSLAVVNLETDTGSVATFTIGAVATSSVAVTVAGASAEKADLNGSNTGVTEIWGKRNQSNTLVSSGNAALTYFILKDSIVVYKGANKVLTAHHIENITGGSGDDIFVFGKDAKLAGSLNAGGGTNTLAYSLPAGVTAPPGYVAYDGIVNVDLTAGTGKASNVDTGKANGINSITHVIGGTRGDTFNADGAANEITGGAGKDTLKGNDGADILAGGEGSDTLIGGADSDTLKGGAGDDTYVFDAGWG
ncbi:DUF4347 domain-containing protein, partial [Neptunomonas sp.]|uniref:DUF4347 domain-containing protein n=1 Tax=Neptunomonas sp. TaxID=1971898 RepID=UPI003561ABCB